MSEVRQCKVCETSFETDDWEMSGEPREQLSGQVCDEHWLEIVIRRTMERSIS